MSIAVQFKKIIQIFRRNRSSAEESLCTSVISFFSVVEISDECTLNVPSTKKKRGSSPPAEGPICVLFPI
jgi:hypothetical protein